MRRRWLFAKEPQILSLLLDGAVHDVRVLLRQYIAARWWSIPTWATWLFDEQAWNWCKDILQRDLDKDGSAKQLLSAREASGSIGVIHSKQDTLVPPFQRDMLIRVLRKTSLKILMEWYPKLQQSEGCENRLVSYMDLPSQYEAFLCTFWSKVFDGAPTSTRCEGFGAPPGIIV